MGIEEKYMEEGRENVVLEEDTFFQRMDISAMRGAVVDAAKGSLDLERLFTGMGLDQLKYLDRLRDLYQGSFRHFAESFLETRAHDFMKEMVAIERDQVEWGMLRPAAGEHEQNGIKINFNRKAQTTAVFFFLNDEKNNLGVLYSGGLVLSGLQPVELSVPYAAMQYAMDLGMAGEAVLSKGNFDMSNMVNGLRKGIILADMIGQEASGYQLHNKLHKLYDKNGVQSWTDACMVTNTEDFQYELDEVFPLYPCLSTREREKRVKLLQCLGISRIAEFYGRRNANLCRTLFDVYLREFLEGQKNRVI